MQQRLSYSDQLKHPNWQRRRLEMLDAAGFACSKCRDAGSTLHVHHKRYVKGRQVWEYSDDELAVLCETCHQDTHDEADAITALTSMIPEERMIDAIGIISGLVYVATGDTSIIEKSQDKIAPLSIMAGISSIKCLELDLTGFDNLSVFLEKEIKESNARRVAVLAKRGVGF